MWTGVAIKGMLVWGVNSDFVSLSFQFSYAGNAKHGHGFISKNKWSFQFGQSLFCFIGF